MENHVALRKGDNDAAKKWGGNVLAEALSYNVTNLQDDLQAVGIYTYKVDGDFGGKTEKAPKIYLWACANMEASIKNGVRTVRVKKGSIIRHFLEQKGV